MDEWLERWTCNMEAQSSGPTLTTSSICSQLGPELNSLVTLLTANWFTSDKLEFSLAKLSVSVYISGP